VTDNPEHVGVLVVHGIGEQRHHETARALAQTIIRELASRGKGTVFSLIDRSGNPSTPPLSCPSADRNSSPFEVVAVPAGKSPVHIHIHEVWWADLGAPGGLMEQMRFWLWGLGQWNAEVKRVGHDPGKMNNTIDVVDQIRAWLRGISGIPDAFFMERAEARRKLDFRCLRQCINNNTIYRRRPDIYCRSGRRPGQPA
jgi:hypothetical protein